MPVSVLYNANLLPTGCDMVGIRVYQTILNGVINNFPLRRPTVPYQVLDIFANNDRQLRLLVRDPELNVVDLTGATCVFTVKELPTDTVPVIELSTAVPAEGMIGAADEGEAFFFLVPADTASLTIEQYVWDVRVTAADGKTYTVCNGLFNLLQTVG